MSGAMGAGPGGNERRPLVFFHLFKCAGTTVIERMRARVGKERVLHVRNAQAFAEDFAEGRDPVGAHDAVAGHLDFRTLDRHLGPAVWVTVLREPIDRMVSQYHHFRAATASADDAPAHRFRVEFCRAHGLAEFAASDDPRITAYTRDFMTRKLSGLPPREAGGTRMLDAALANLARFALVGTTDRLDTDFLPALDRLLPRRGLRLPAPARANVGASRSAGPADRRTLEAVIDCNRQDLVLYAAARWFDLARNQPATGQDRP